MLVGAALQELKILQSKLARLYRLREDTFNVLEKKTIEVPYKRVTEEIDDLIQQIRKMKVNIHKTNSNTLVLVDNKKISLQELIILIGDVRSDLMRLDMLKPRGPVYLGGQAVEYIPQKKQDEIAKIIGEKEKQKADLDKILQAKNWQTELLE